MNEFFQFQIMIAWVICINNMFDSNRSDQMDEINEEKHCKSKKVRKDQDVKWDTWANILEKMIKSFKQLN